MQYTQSLHPLAPDIIPRIHKVYIFFELAAHCTTSRHRMLKQLACFVWLAVVSLILLLGKLIQFEYS